MRLCLLSKNSLKCLLRERSALTRNDKCVKIIKSFLNEKSTYRQKNPITRYRYCDHDMFNVLICGVGIGGAYYKNVHEIDGRTLKHLETDSMTMSRSSSKAVYLKGEVFVFLRLYRL